MVRKYHRDGTHPEPDQVFVFGSNLSGIHGAGAAQAAYDFYGATWGQGVGISGMSYAIPTKDYGIRRTLSLEEIKPYIDQFILCVGYLPNIEFFVTRIGCGLAGYKDSDIAPLFVNAPGNCSMPFNWFNYLSKK